MKQLRQTKDSRVFGGYVTNEIISGIIGLSLTFISISGFTQIITGASQTSVYFPYLVGKRIAITAIKNQLSAIPFG
jgi:hypothetical protein